MTQTEELACRYQRLAAHEWARSYYIDPFGNRRMNLQDADWARIFYARARFWMGIE